MLTKKAGRKQDKKITIKLCKSETGSYNGKKYFKSDRRKQKICFT